MTADATARGGRPPSLDAEKVEQVIAALDGGASKASGRKWPTCRPRTLAPRFRREIGLGLEQGVFRVDRLVTISDRIENRLRIGGCRHSGCNMIASIADVGVILAKFLDERDDLGCFLLAEDREL